MGSGAGKNIKSKIGFAGAVIDKDTGELMEYRHFMSNTKYQEMWGKSAGNKNRR